ncbi:hypothetical protein ACVGW4_10530, partial [Enterobacter hormaechei]
NPAAQGQMTRRHHRITKILTTVMNKKSLSSYRQRIYRQTFPLAQEACEEIIHVSYKNLISHHTRL